MAKTYSDRINRYFYLSRSYLKFLLTGKALSYPLTIQIQTKSLCNGRCIFCPYPETSKKFEPGTMAIETFQKIVSELASEKFWPRLLFELHNEPLLDERIFEMIKYVKTHTTGIRCAIVTNGQLLDKYSIEDIKQSEVDQIAVSLNAYSREMYAHVSSGLDFDRIINNISTLVSDETVKKKLTVSFVITRDSARDVFKALRYWKEKGVKTRTIDLLNRAGTVKNYDSLKLNTDKDIKFTFAERTARYLIKRILKIIGCYYPFYHMSILYNGDIILCCDDWERATILGNIRINTIKEVWNAPAINNIRRLILKKKYSAILSCKNCSKAT